jgi:hypothetical protein
MIASDIRLYAARAEHLQRFTAAHHPRREDEIGITHRVVGMQMSQKSRGDVHGGTAEGADASLIRGHHAADHAGPKIDEIGEIVDDDGSRGAGTLGVGKWRSGAQHHHARDHRITARRERRAGSPAASSSARSQQRNGFPAGTW